MSPVKWTLEPSPGPHDPAGRAFWPTPAWCVEALLRESPPTTDWVVEPSAGEGAICEVLRHRYSVIAFEIRPECLEPLHTVFREGVNSSQIRISDFLEIGSVGLGRFSIVGNPPHDPASVMLKHVEHCLELGPAYCALLLPLRFLGSAERLIFNEIHPPRGLYPLCPRPRFAEGGGSEDVAWFVWDNAPARIRVLAKDD